MSRLDGTNMPRMMRVAVRKKIELENERVRKRERDRVAKLEREKEEARIDRRTGRTTATPETKRKLRASVVAKLAKTGRFDERQLIAARMLGGLWLAIEAGGMQSVDSIERLKSFGLSGSRKTTEPVAFVMFDPTYLNVFRPWRAWAEAEVIRTRIGRVTAYDVVYFCVCYNVGPRQLDDVMHVRHGASIALIDKALQRFDDEYRSVFRGLKQGH